MHGALRMATRVERASLTRRLAQISELVGVFIPACIAIMVGTPLVGDNPLARHGVIFVANVLMLVMVWFLPSDARSAGTLALQTDGSIASWGHDYFGQATAPPGSTTSFK